MRHFQDHPDTHFLNDYGRSPYYHASILGLKTPTQHTFLHPATPPPTLISSKHIETTPSAASAAKGVVSIYELDQKA